MKQDGDYLETEKKDFKPIEIKMKPGRESSEDGKRIDYTENKTKGIKPMQICKERPDRNLFSDSAENTRGILHQTPPPTLLSSLLLGDT